MDDRHIVTVVLEDVNPNLGTEKVLETLCVLLVFSYIRCKSPESLHVIGHTPSSDPCTLGMTYITIIIEKL